MKKYEILFAKLKQNFITIVFFIVLIIAIFLLFYNQIVGIWLCVISIIILVISVAVSYFTSVYIKKKILTFVKKKFKAEDNVIARELKHPLQKIQEKMYELSQNQTNKGWLIVFLERHYISYNKKTIERFNELYSKGSNEKEILEGLNKNHLKTRAEVKIIRDTLSKLNRLSEK